MPRRSTSASPKAKTRPRPADSAAQQRALRAAHASLNPEDAFKAIARQACVLTASRSSAIYALDTDTNTLELVAGHRLPAGMSGRAPTPSEGVLGRAVRVRRALIGSLDNVAAISLIVHGRCWGVLEVMRGRRARPFELRDLAALEWFAPMAAQSIANAHEFYHSVQAISQFQIANERLRAAGNLARQVMDMSHDLDQMLAQVVDGACRSLRLRCGAVRLHDERSEQLVTLIDTGLPLSALDRVPPRNAVLIEPLSEMQDEGTLITVPLVARERLIGVMQWLAAPGREITLDDRDALAIVANQLALGVENAQLLQQVQTEDQWLRAILSSTDNVVFSVDSEGRLLTANAAAERAFGFRAEEHLGRSFDEVTTNIALNLALDQAICRGDTRRRTFQVPLSDDRVLFASMSPILSPESVVQGWVLVMQDVTQLQEMEKLRADMILTASHELRNPVNLTLGALELLERSLDTPSLDQREALDLARLGVERASLLITDLLDLERIERRVGLKMAPCDCARLLRSIQVEFRLRAEQRRTQLQVCVPEAALIVWGDERLLHRVLSNLVDNALKYTPSGGSVVVEARMEAGQVLLEVADTGQGIPLEAQPYVFERFYRLSNQPEGVTGTGLGLTLVKSIVEQHGGRVWVTSQPGHGSVFTVSLPLFQSVDR